MQFKILVMFTTAMVVSACGGGGSGGTAGTGPSSPPAVTPPPAIVSITATGPVDAVPGGGTTRIALTVTNSGRGTATDLVIAPNLSDHVDRGTVICTASGLAVCPSVAGATFAVPSLPPGASLTFQIDVTLVSGAHGPLTNSSVVTASNDDSTSDNRAESVINAYSADVSVTGSGPGSAVAAGDISNYTMTVTNAGPDAARNVAIGNWLDSGQLLRSMTCAASGGAVCPTQLGANMSVSALPVGGALSFSITSTVRAGTSGSITNGMFATSAGDPQPGNNYAAGQGKAVFTPPGTANVVQLQSDPGDYVGQGESYTYAQSNATLSVTATTNHLNVEIVGDQRWTGNFALPAAMTQIQPGTYTNLQRYGLADPAVGGIEWTGQGRGCDSIKGSLAIDSASYVDGQLASVSLAFEQHCEGATEALRGQIRWNAVDTTAPPGPLSQLPPNLWAPASGATPTSGSYVYLQSDAFDYIDRGATQTYTKANAVLSVAVAGGHVTVQTVGNEKWTGEFQAMTGVSQLQPGYYVGSKGYPFHNPAKGGLDWFGEGRDCNEAGWFVVDDITYLNGVLATLDLRFEQHCEDSVPALHGKIHWDASDATAPPGPVNPPPADLWAPAAGATPSTGSYIYLVSDPGDIIGVGRTATYTPANATVTLRTSGAHLGVSVAGTDFYQGDFQGMSILSQLQPGYYPNLQRYPFNNPAIGGMSWGGSCNTVTGWFAIDSISYSSGAVTSIDLRFEQHCDGNPPALRGRVHWGP